MVLPRDPSNDLDQNRISRRDLLLSTGKAAAGLAVAGALPAALNPRGALAAASFAGGTLNVTYWPGLPHQDALVSVFNGFGQKNGLTVKFNPEPLSFGDTVQKFTTYLSSGYTGIDLYWLDEFMTATFGTAGWLEPLEGHLSHATVASVGPGPLKLSRYGGHLVRMPGYSGGILFFYRKDLFDKAGLRPPTTWQELLAAGKRFSRGGRYGLGFAGKNGNTQLFNELSYWMGQAGASPLHLKHPAARQTLQFIYDMLHTHKIMPPNTVTADYSSILAEFIDGRIAMWPVWASNYSAILASKPFSSKYKLAVGFPPRGPANGKSLADSWGWAVSAHSQNKDLAFKFIEYATSAQSEATIAPTGTIPARLADLSYSKVQKALPYTPFLAQYNRRHLFHARPITAQAQRVSDALEAVINQYLNKQISLNAAINTGQQQVDQILGR